MKRSDIVKIINKYNISFSEDDIITYITERKTDNFHYIDLLTGIRYKIIINDNLFCIRFQLIPKYYNGRFSSRTLFRTVNIDIDLHKALMDFHYYVLKDRNRIQQNKNSANILCQFLKDRVRVDIR